ncbi:MAG: tRNA preQ1(34) S-adenosylmethionine ribosyltransferase-isomerase QueA [Sedimentisphaerales bacterium]|nr:tRNA preQ1(34) S-adenosylmethionine ribosyltransferase-isomerase QueA [Sedimentisphaerales bacterium]
METARLQYNLPEELIAQEALTDRSKSRLMVLDRKSGTISHRLFRDITSYLRKGDCLVINETKVVPARFYLRRSTGGQIEGLFLRLTEECHWEVMLKNASRVKLGEDLKMVLPDELATDSSPVFRAVARTGQGYWLIKPVFPGVDFCEILEQYGSTPLPPYIKRDKQNPTELSDRSRYQTVYANAGAPGSVAAPTAGLHFDDELLAECVSRGIKIARVTLHVGPGTFKPVEAENLKDHVMHSEWYQIDADNAGVINDTVTQGGRVIAVGTTSVRTLETLACGGGKVNSGSGWTDIFIMPGYEFKVVSGIITNFHLPGSTLLALVSAFYGLERTMSAYNKAVAEKYRFYSYGDAMFIIDI